MVDVIIIMSRSGDSDKVAMRIDPPRVRQEKRRGRGLVC